MNDLSQFVEVLFYLNICDKKMSCIQSNIFWNFNVWLGNKYKINIYFPSSNKQFGPLLNLDFCFELYQQSYY